MISTASAAAAATATAQKQRALDPNEVAYLAVAYVQGQHHLARDEGMLLYLYRDGVYRSDEVDVYLRRLVKEWIVAEHGPPTSTRSC